MSVLIKGMEPSTRCLGCKFELYGQYCFLLGSYTNDTRAIGRLDNCPVVGLPEKHGRLIDGDVLWDAMLKYNDNEGAKMPFGYDDTSIHIDSACFVIENAPTVIEAEGDE